MRKNPNKMLLIVILFTTKCNKNNTTITILTIQSFGRCFHFTLLTNQLNHLVTNCCFTKQFTAKKQLQWVAPGSVRELFCSWYTNFHNQLISHTQVMSNHMPHNFRAPFQNQQADLPVLLITVTALLFACFAYDQFYTPQQQNLKPMLFQFHIFHLTSQSAIRVSQEKNNLN